ncbi:hypothetical protein SAMN05216548_101547 [Faunimonas pinastri]|uniref:Uncharacterized protein n=1 Tax=Faunimonas pinastri TaxID=1855383 RepID=A0A1H9AX93_9HYPH|nr:hypothetical protein [Faunimonas pinastri]SEP81107.1 hypothetical protein SAMN05216548_101547 [Faunimonas pinastri]
MTFAKTVLAAALVVGSAAAFAAPASAQDRTVVIEHDGGPMHHRGPWMDHRPMHPPMHRNCMVRTTRTMHHGQTVIRKERMCR